MYRIDSIGRTISLAETSRTTHMSREMINACRSRAQTHHAFPLGAVEIRRHLRGQQRLKRGCTWDAGRLRQGTQLRPPWQAVKAEAAQSPESHQNFKVTISCN